MVGGWWVVVVVVVVVVVAPGCKLLRFTIELDDQAPCHCEELGQATNEQSPLDFGISLRWRQVWGPLGWYLHTQNIEGGC